MKRRWYRTDEKENAIDFLESAARFRADHKKHKWKWVVVSLHGALYGFAVLAIKGTDPARVMIGNRLVSFPEAIRRCKKDEYMLQNYGSVRLEMSEDEENAVTRLSEDFRNNFQHFIPVLWSIELKSFLEILPPICRVIKFLALECGNVRLTLQQRRNISSALKRIRG